MAHALLIHRMSKWLLAGAQCFPGTVVVDVGVVKMLWKRKLGFYALAAACLLGVGTKQAHACDDYYGCGSSYDSSWSGLYNTGGYDVYQLGVDIYNYSSYSSGYDYGSYGGGCGSLISSCSGGYDLSGLYGSSWGLGSYGSSGYGLGIDNSVLGGLGFGYSPYTSLYGDGSYGTGFGTGLGGNDIGCALGYCGGSSSLPYYSPDLFNGSFPYSLPGMTSNPFGLPGTNPFAPQYPSPMLPPYTNFPVSGFPPPLNAPYPLVGGTPPLFNGVPRDPSQPYLPPPPNGGTMPWGGCDGVVIPCPTGPVSRNFPGQTFVPPSLGGGSPTFTGPSTPVVHVAPSVTTFPGYNGGGTTHGWPGMVTSTPPVNNTVPRDPSQPFSSPNGGGTSYVSPTVTYPSSGGGSYTSPTVTYPGAGNPTFTGPVTTTYPSSNGGSYTTPVVSYPSTGGNGTGGGNTFQTPPTVQYTPTNPNLNQVPRGARRW